MTKSQRILNQSCVQSQGQVNENMDSDSEASRDEIDKDDFQRNGQLSQRKKNTHSDMKHMFQHSEESNNMKEPVRDTQSVQHLGLNEKWHFLSNKQKEESKKSHELDDIILDSVEDASNNTEHYERKHDGTDHDSE